MPVTTSVYIHDPVDYRIVFARCAVLLGTPASTRTGDDGGMVFTTTDQVQLAWTWVEYGNGGPPLRPAADPHTAQCAPGCARRHAPGCARRHAPACWIEAAFDAEDGYRDDHGGPGALNQRFVAALGRWLDDQEVRWSWRTHDDGILHDGQDGFAELAALDG